MKPASRTNRRTSSNGTRGATATAASNPNGAVSDTSAGAAAPGCGCGRVRRGGVPYVGSFAEAPEYNKDNPYILSGYRINHNTLATCLRSLFRIHNETGNVWTHLVGFFIFAVAAWHTMTVVLRDEPAHYGIFIAFTATCFGCMLTSTTYHLMNCHSREVLDSTLRCDYCGISTLIIGSFLPPVYFGFQCMPYARIGYLTMIGILGGTITIAPFFRFWDSPEFHTKRVTLYALTVASGVIPAIHSTLAAPINGVTMPLHRGIIFMFLLYGLGTVVYVAKWPERWFPGRFDLWLNSHQIWHVFVFGAAFVHFYTCVGVYQRHSFDQC